MYGVKDVRKERSTQTSKTVETAVDAGGCKGKT